MMSLSVPMKLTLTALLAAACLHLTSCNSSTSQEASTYMIRPHEVLPIPDSARQPKGYTSIFLAGTIDMGKSSDWQQDLYDRFSRTDGRWILYNPRQLQWDPTREGEMDYQVNWELEYLEKADYILMYILGSSKSPISLLEMGIHDRSGKMYVICEPDFYRYDNVRITCSYYDIPLFHSMEEFWAWDACPFKD